MNAVDMKLTNDRFDMLICMYKFDISGINGHTVKHNELRDMADYTECNLPTSSVGGEIAKAMPTIIAKITNFISESENASRLTSFDDDGWMVDHPIALVTLTLCN